MQDGPSRDAAQPYRATVWPDHGPGVQVDCQVAGCGLRRVRCGFAVVWPVTPPDGHAWSRAASDHAGAHDPMAKPHSTGGT